MINWFRIHRWQYGPTLDMNHAGRKWNELISRNMTGRFRTIHSTCLASECPAHFCSDCPPLSDDLDSQAQGQSSSSFQSNVCGVARWVVLPSLLSLLSSHMKARLEECCWLVEGHGVSKSELSRMNPESPWWSVFSGFRSRSQNNLPCCE